MPVLSQTAALKHERGKRRQERPLLCLLRTSKASAAVFPCVSVRPLQFSELPTPPVADDLSLTAQFLATLPSKEEERFLSAVSDITQRVCRLEHYTRTEQQASRVPCTRMYYVMP